MQGEYSMSLTVTVLRVQLFISILHTY